MPSLVSTSPAPSEVRAPAVDAAAPFFDPEPPHWAARGLAYILIALFAVAVAAAILVRIPEAVSCPFVLLPTRGTDPVRAPRSGVVSEVRVAPAASVSRGEPLFVIRSPDIGDRAAELRTLETVLDGGATQLANARREHDSQTLADEQEARKLDHRLVYLADAIIRQQRQLAMSRELVARYESAYRKGFASWLEFVDHQMDANETAMRVAELVSSEKEARTAREQLRHQAVARDVKFAELERGLGETMATARIRIGALRDELTDSVSNALAVPAPCGGTVLALVVKGVGAYVHEGDVLGELACAGERLQAELRVPEAGVGRIRPGQGVKLLYDAFPYERYGVKFGTVRWVSPSSVDGGQGRHFRALADIETDSVRVDDQQRPLVAGMGGTARVVVGRRSVISAAFAPLRQLQESFRDAPARPLGAPQEGARPSAD